MSRLPVAINQGYIALVCNKVLSPVYTIQWLDYIMDDVKQRAGGTTFSEISKRNFRDIPLLVPSHSSIDAFSRFAESLYDSVACNLRESAELELIRNTLLPKLLSGQLTIPDAERLVSNAT